MENLKNKTLRGRKKEGCLAFYVMLLNTFPSAHTAVQIICKQLHRTHRRLPEPPFVAPAVCNSVRAGLRSLVRPGATGRK